MRQVSLLERIGNGPHAGISPGQVALVAATAYGKAPRITGTPFSASRWSGR